MCAPLLPCIFVHFNQLAFPRHSVFVVEDSADALHFCKPVIGGCPSVVITLVEISGISGNQWDQMEPVGSMEINRSQQKPRNSSLIG